MARRRYTPEQIIRHLRQAEVLTSQVRNVPDIFREIRLKHFSCHLRKFIKFIT